MIDFEFGVKLGPVSKESLPTLLEWRNDIKIRRWCRQYDLLQWEEHLKWYERLSFDPTISMYSIFSEKEVVGSKCLVGVCGLTDIDRVNARAEFSLYIGPNHHKKGYAGAALRTLFAHGFMAHNLNLIWGETFDGNPAGKIFEKIGMIREGTRREFYFREGKYIDAHLFSITKKEFIK